MIKFNKYNKGIGTKFFAFTYYDKLLNKYFT